MITVRYLNGKSICLVTIYLHFFFPFWHDIGSVSYTHLEVEDGALDIMHTIVPPPLEGKGIAAALVEATYKSVSYTHLFRDKHTRPV